MADIYVKEGESNGRTLEISVLVGAHEDDVTVKDVKGWDMSRYEVICEGSKYVGSDGYDIWIERNNFAYETNELGHEKDEKSFVDEDNVQIVKKAKVDTFMEALKIFADYVEDAKQLVKIELK